MLEVDKSWFPIMNLVYREPLNTLNTEILPNISFNPSKENIFKVFSMPLDKIKVVILGQDPYPTKGMATGLAFENGILENIPLSLRYIYKEIQDSTQNQGDIHNWFSQGVFLLNTALTVETGNAGSHLSYWSEFTKAVVQYISAKRNVIWLLWGTHAMQYDRLISRKFFVDGYDRKMIEQIPISDFNYVLKAPHPAAEIYRGGKAGFFGCDCFYKSNVILSKQKSGIIVW